MTNKMKKVILIIVGILLGILALILYLNQEEAEHRDYAEKNNCEWYYMSNGFEVCK